MTDCLIPQSLEIIKLLQMSRNRSEKQAERALQKLHEQYNPRTKSELVGALVDQLIQDLVFLEQKDTDAPLERRPEPYPA